MNSRCRLFLLSALVLGGSCPCEGASFIVPSGVQAPAQSLTTAGDTGIVEEGGVILTGSAVGVSMNANQQIVDNAGVIATSGNSHTGVIAAGANSSVYNRGLITTNGTSSIGIRVIGNNTHAINSGKIETLALGSAGMLLTDSAAKSTLTNLGRITTFGSNSVGMGATSLTTNSIIENKGVVTTFGTQSAGIRTIGANSTIINEGRIHAKGTSASGIRVDGVNSSVINSGTVISDLNYALEFTSNANLTLEQGSNIQGYVFLANPGANILQVKKGLNLALTSLNGTWSEIKAKGNPYAVNGQTVAVVDRTGFARQYDMLDDLTSLILNNLDQCDLLCSCGEKKFWIRGMGNYRDRDETSRLVGYKEGMEGLMMGVELPFLCDGRIGLFEGGTYGEAHLDHHIQQFKTTSLFAGLYADAVCSDIFYRVAFAGGYFHQKGKRRVMNNIASEGVEHAHSRVSGAFIAPEIWVAKPFFCLGYQPLLSGTVRYSGLFLNKYKEHGSQADLSVNSHSLQIVTARADIAVPIPLSFFDCSFDFIPYTGLEGRFKVGGNDLHGRLLQQHVSFCDGSEDSLGTLFVGFRSCNSYDCDMSLVIDCEAGIDNNSSALVRGGVKLVWDF